MSKLRFRISEDASDEIDDAVSWYYRQSVNAAEAFTDELERAFDLIASSPTIWPTCIEDVEARRYVLRKFPYSVVYFISAEELVIVAVAHHKRDPGYWLHR